MFRSNVKLLTWSLIIVIIDQLSKLAVVKFFYIGQSVKILGNVLRFTFIKNPGMAFGIQIGNRILFAVFAGIAGIIILIYLFRIKPENYWARFGLASILGGAIGNLIDRIIYKEVIDFIDIRIIHWPVFNVADIAVTIGMIILIAYVVFEKDHPESEEEHFESG